MERHGHLDLDPHVRDSLLAVSAATIGRLLKSIRRKAGSRRRRRRGQGQARQRVPVRTFAEWGTPAPGLHEIDFVAHCGGKLSGAFIDSLVVTDVCSGRTEAVPLLAREQALVAQGLEVIGRLLPVPIRGIDFDNDGAFVNDTLVRYCASREIAFTRSRPCRKNDQAWMEQKNSAVVRRFVGYARYVGPVAVQRLSHLYGAVRQ